MFAHSGRTYWERSVAGYKPGDVPLGRLDIAVEVQEVWQAMTMYSIAVKDRGRVVDSASLICEAVSRSR